MNEVSIIDLDLAKNVFHAHGASANGSVVFRRKLSRGPFLKFFTAQPSYTVAMEALRQRSPLGAGDRGLQLFFRTGLYFTAGTP